MLANQTVDSYELLTELRHIGAARDRHIASPPDEERRPTLVRRTRVGRPRQALDDSQPAVGERSRQVAGLRREVGDEGV